MVPDVHTLLSVRVSCASFVFKSLVTCALPTCSLPARLRCLKTDPPWMVGGTAELSDFFCLLGTDPGSWKDGPDQEENENGNHDEDSDDAGHDDSELLGRLCAEHRANITLPTHNGPLPKLRRSQLQEEMCHGATLTTPHRGSTFLLRRKINHSCYPSPRRMRSIRLMW